MYRHHLAIGLTGILPSALCRKAIFFIFYLIFLISLPASAQIAAVRTDLLMDVCSAPSLGVELALTKKSSLNIDGFYGSKMFGKDIKIIALQPEWRCYISGRPMYHHYVGIVGALENHDITVYSRHYDGHGIGIGVSYGYVWPITQRLLLDFHTSLAYYTYKQKEHFVDDDYDSHYTNADGYPVANASGSFLMPVKLGIALSYILK